MKYLFTLLLLSAGILSHGQTIPAVVKTTKTAAHINIPSTKLFLIAPAGFTLSQDLPAIEKGQDGIIQVLDQQDAGFSAELANFNKKGFELLGLRMLDYKELTINGYVARLALLEGNDGTRTYRLLFGDTTFSVLLIGSYVRTDDKTGSDILKSMLTAYYDKSVKIEPFGQAIFTLDDTHTRLKFAQYSGGMYKYSFNGRTEGSDDNPVFLVSVMPADATMPELMADLLLNQLRASGFNVLSTENPITEKVNGLPSFHREAYGTYGTDTKKMLIYLHVVIIDHTAIVMQGQASANFSTYIKDFQALGSTIRKK
jgi:hypothetical protein